MNSAKKKTISFARKIKRKLEKKVIPKVPILSNYWAPAIEKIISIWGKRDLYNYPIFISYPRSGSHWINAMMEVYFNRPRIRHGDEIYIDKSRDDWMWVHDDDLDLKVMNNIIYKNKNNFGKTLFLYRNPIDVIYSYIRMQLSDDRKTKNRLTKKMLFSDENVKRHFLKWIAHHKEYTKNSKDKQFTFIKYENFLEKTKRAKEFEKIANHFSYPFNKDKIECIFEEFGKGKIARYRDTSEKKYKMEREEFTRKWQPYINNLLSENDIKI